MNAPALSVPTYHRACSNALQWCLKFQQSDGSIAMPDRCFDSIYKFPAAFLVMGRYVEAGKILSWLENETLTDSGDFAFPERKHIFSWFDAFYTYTNSWIILAAQRAGFFRLADRAVTYLLRFQNPVTGAFRSARVETDQTGICDTTITSQGVICSLYTGHLPQAFLAIDALCRIAESQRTNQPLFYYRVDRNGNLLTTPHGGNALWTYVDSRTDGGQLYYPLGIAAAALVHAYELSGNQRYLECARIYIEFVLRCGGSLRSFASGKVGYALAMLYRSTGDGRYRQKAVEYLDWLADVQKPDGHWMLDEWEPRDWYFTYDCTAEFVYWVSEMTKLLSSPRQTS